MDLIVVEIDDDRVVKEVVVPSINAVNFKNDCTLIFYFPIQKVVLPLNKGF